MLIHNNMINDIINGKLIKFELLFMHYFFEINYHKYLLTKLCMYNMHKMQTNEWEKEGIISTSFTNCQ